MGFQSNHGQVLLALEALLRSLKLDGLTDEEVRIRYNWLQNGQPRIGVSILDLGEKYADGTVGTQDIGYLCGIVFADGATYDDPMDNDRILSWIEVVRRRLTDQRLNVTIAGATDPAEHVMVIDRSGENLTNPNKYPNYKVRRTVVSVWLREKNP